MSTELQQYEAPTTDLLPGSRETRATGAAAIMEAAQVMDSARTLAEAICRTAMVPDHFKGKPDECAAAMLYGSALGLDPMQSVKAIYVVYGNAALYAQAMDALVKGAGHETWTVESGPTKVVRSGRRAGSSHIETSEWTIERAEQAGYVPTIDPSTGKYAVNKNGKLIGNEKYLSDPETMLRWKATAELCRILAPDVLNGVYSVEEREMDYVESEVVEVKRPTKGLGAALATNSSPAPGEAPKAATAAKASGAGEALKLGQNSKLAKDLFAAIAAAQIPQEDVPDFFLSVLDRRAEGFGDLTVAEAEKALAALRQAAEQS